METLNNIENKIQQGVITDEMISFLAEMDSLNSKTTKAWLVKVIRKAFEIARTTGIKYKNTTLNEIGLEKILEDPLSEFVIRSGKEV